MMLASLAETKGALIIDHNDDDAALTLMIQAASEAILDYLKVDSFEVIPHRAKLATIVCVHHFYQPSEGQNAFDGSRLPDAVLALLLPMRVPTVA